jgi:malate dehydrogenase (oxaloacetate-decarboxylating)
MANRPGALGRLATAIGDAGGNITALEGFDVRGAYLDEDVIVNCSSEEHIERVRAAVQGLADVELIECADRTFLMHDGGKIEVLARMPIVDRDDRRRPRAGPRPDDQEEHRRDRHRRHRGARPR